MIKAEKKSEHAASHQLKSSWHCKGRKRRRSRCNRAQAHPPFHAALARKFAVALSTAPYDHTITPLLFVWATCWCSTTPAMLELMFECVDQTVMSFKLAMHMHACSDQAF